ncbi:MAG TPA: amidohydrolase [Actinomycetota bacterium]
MGDRADCDLLLTGGAVITMDGARRVLDPGIVAVAEDRIVAVDTVPDGDQGWNAARTVDCRGCVVMPGLVDCHNHLFNSLSRGLGEGLSLWPWLRDFKWPYNSSITRDEAVAAVKLSAVEAARAGVTSVLDHAYAPTEVETTLAIADAIELVGLRGVVARGMLGPRTPGAEKKSARAGRGRDLYRNSVGEEIAMTEECMKARPPGSRVAVWPGPLDVIYTSPELIRGAHDLAGRYGSGWHAHCSESQSDVPLFAERHGLRPIEWMAGEGLLRGRTTLAHMIWLDDREIALLGETGAGIAHNPVSNAYMGSGVIRLRELRDAGAVVGLGTDGPNVGHRQDMFEAMKTAILLQRIRTLDATTTSAEEALELATREGARYLGIDAGSISPGMLADLIVVDVSGAHTVPDNRAVTTAVYAARSSDVSMTIVGGDIVYEDGRCTRVDEDSVLEEARERSADLIHRAQLGDFLTPWATVPGRRPVDG